MASRRPPSDDFDDDPTIVESGEITPQELPRCSECGTVVFFDNFSEPAAALAYGLFQSRQCLAGKLTIGQPGSWYWCADRRKYVCWVP